MQHKSFYLSLQAKQNKLRNPVNKTIKGKQNKKKNQSVNHFLSFSSIDLKFDPNVCNISKYANLITQILLKFNLDSSKDIERQKVFSPDVVFLLFFNEMMNTRGPEGSRAYSS